jgi:hypothetical protein
MPFSAYALDRHVATKLSEFTSAEIPDMTEHAAEQNHWVANFILNSTFTAAFKYPYQQHAFAMLRRAEMTFRDYDLARSQTLEYLRKSGSPSQYFIALSHWEHFLASAYTAMDCFRRFAQLGPQEMFKKNDGSTLQRLNMIYNVAKHANDTQYPPEATLAVWLDNDGLCSLEGRLSYSEISSEVLPLVAELADRIQNPNEFHKEPSQT